MNPRPPTVFTTLRSVLTIAPSERRACDDIHRLHSLVSSGFPTPQPTTNDPAPRPAHVLFAAQRGTPHERNGRRTAAPPERLLVQSPTIPDWTPLLDTGRLTEARTFTATHVLRTDDIIEIRVIANPVMKNHRTRQRISLSTPGDAAEWLRRHLARSGLQTQPHHIDPGHGIRTAGTHRRTGGTITTVYREMTAHCRILDPDALARALTQGIGHAKTYGCGLLRLRPHQ